MFSAATEKESAERLKDLNNAFLRMIGKMLENAREAEPHAPFSNRGLRWHA